METKNKNPVVSNIERIRQLVVELKLYRKWHAIAYDYRHTPSNVRHLDVKSLRGLARQVCSEFDLFEQYCKSLISDKNEPKN